jgi:hypothetical protein
VGDGEEDARDAAPAREPAGVAVERHACAAIRAEADLDIPPATACPPVVTQCLDDGFLGGEEAREPGGGVAMVARRVDLGGREDAAVARAAAGQLRPHAGDVEGVHAQPDDHGRRPRGR